jgi:hypothetical protein
MAVEEGALGGMPAVELPRSHVLSYVTTVTSATRVREVAARGLKVLGWGQVAFAIFILGWGCWIVWEDMLGRWGGTAGWTTWDFINRIADQLMSASAFLVAVSVLLVCFAASLLLCARPVLRGSRSGCLVAKSCMVPSVLLLYYATALVACYAIIVGTGMFREPENRRYLLLLLFLPPLAVLLAALWDLWEFLGWIARNPATEKPRVAFLS